MRRLRKTKLLLQKHCYIFVTLLVLNIMLLYLAYMAQVILREEVYKKNIQSGITKCAITVNDLDNIVYFGENIVNFTERDFSYLSESDAHPSTYRALINNTYRICEGSDYYYNIYAAYDGKVISARKIDEEKIVVSGKNWYEKALHTEGVVITSPYEDAVTNEPVITISKRIGNTSNVVALDILLDKIQHILIEQVAQEDSMELGCIVNNDAVIIGHSKNMQIGVVATDDSVKYGGIMKLFINQILKDESGQITYDTKTNQYTILYQKTASDWHVIYVANKDLIKNEIRRLHYGFAAVYFVIFMLMNSFIITLYMKREKAMLLKEKAEKAEKNLLNYKDQLEKLVAKRTDDVKKQSLKLKQLNASIIDNLADIVEFRDLESGQHIKRIKAFTYCLANKMSQLYPEYSLDKANIDLMCQAAALHDIGKIGIPDHVLLKPGKLTVEEFELMKEHTLIGDELVTRILTNYDQKLTRYSHDICKYHHERYDGRGYPEHLIGDDIPICAQIVGIADVYDALREKRVYKDAFSHEVAVQMIKNGECGTFSEKLLHCFELVEEEFREISQSYTD